MQKITPFLWFNGNAEEAANFYVATFKNSRINHITYYGEGMPMPAGSVMTVSFELEGQAFVGLNGGPQFPFTEAISLSVGCETQGELDDLWNRLTAGGGRAVACGWLKDKYGLSWQIVPAVIEKLFASGNQKKINAMHREVVSQVKLDIAKIQQAYDNG